MADGVRRIAVRVRNDSPWSGDDREDALRQSFCSTHVVLRAGAGGFVSLTDPPGSCARAGRGLRERGLLARARGEEGDRSTVLCSPIILGDYPEIAPESPGDLFDGGEIDQLLILNILSLTDEEKREMRDSDPARPRDPRAHRGAVRGRADAVACGEAFVKGSWEELERPAPDAVEVGGVEVRRRSQVLLRPHPGGDVFDVALSGRTAVVEEVVQGMEGGIQLA